RLDNSTAHPGSPNLTHNGFSDEKSGQLDRICWQADPRQAANFEKRGLQWSALTLVARCTSSRIAIVALGYENSRRAAVENANPVGQIFPAAAFCAVGCTSRSRPVFTSKIAPRTGTSFEIHGCDLTFWICSRVFCSGSRKEKNRIGAGEELAV